MTIDDIVTQAETGMLPADALRRILPLLAQRQDPAAADLLILIDKRRLWRRWGYASMLNYCMRTGIPEPIVRCTSAFLLIEELDKPRMSLERNAALRQAIITLCDDRPLGISRQLFTERLKAILGGLDKVNAESGNWSDQ